MMLLKHHLPIRFAVFLSETMAIFFLWDEIGATSRSDRGLTWLHPNRALLCVMLYCSPLRKTVIGCAWTPLPSRKPYPSRRPFRGRTGEQGAVPLSLTVRRTGTVKGSVTVFPH